MGDQKQVFQKDPPLPGGLAPVLPYDRRNMQGVQHGHQRGQHGEAAGAASVTLVSTLITRSDQVALPILALVPSRVPRTPTGKASGGCEVCSEPTGDGDYYMCSGTGGHDRPVAYHAGCIIVPGDLFEGEPAGVPTGSFLGVEFKCRKCIFYELVHRRPDSGTDDLYILGLITAAVVDAERGRWADSTRQQYDRHINGRVREFEERYAGQNIIPEPDGSVDPRWTALFYEHCSRTRMRRTRNDGPNAGITPGAIGNIRAAIRGVCDARGVTSPTTDPFVRDVLSGIARRSQHISKQAPPIHLELFIAMCIRLATPAPGEAHISYTASCAYTALAMEFFGFFRGSDTESITIDEITFNLSTASCEHRVPGGCSCYVGVDQGKHKTNPHGLSKDQHKLRNRVIMAMRPRCGCRLDRIIKAHILRQACRLPAGAHNNSFPLLAAVPDSPAEFNPAAPVRTVSSESIVTEWRRAIRECQAHDDLPFLEHADADSYTRHSAKHGGNEAARAVKNDDKAAIIAHGWAARRERTTRRPVGDMSDWYDSIQDACNGLVRRLQVTLGI